MKKHTRNLFALMLIFTVLATLFAPAASAAGAVVDGQSLTLEVTVSLSDHPSDMPDETYTVVLTPEDADNPMPSSSDLKIVGEGSGEFGAMTYTKPGIYKYTITQTPGSTERWTYDDGVYNVTVYATNKESGDGLDINVAIYKDGATEKTGEIVFENVYDPLPVTVELVASKTMDGKTPEDGAFSFALKKDGEEIETVTNTGEVVSFSDLTFEEEGVYDYTISEIKGSDKRIRYDATVYTAHVFVYQDGDLVANVTYLKNGEEYEGAVEFKNVTGPPMGDDTNLGLWIGISAVSLLVIVLILIFGKKRKEN